MCELAHDNRGHFYLALTHAPVGIEKYLQQSYDPACNKAIYGHYPNYPRAYPPYLNALHEEALQALPHEVLALSDDFVNNSVTY